MMYAKKKKRKKKKVFSLTYYGERASYLESRKIWICQKNGLEVIFKLFFFRARVYRGFSYNKAMHEPAQIAKTTRTTQ